MIVKDLVYSLLYFQVALYLFSKFLGLTAENVWVFNELQRCQASKVYRFSGFPNFWAGTIPVELGTCSQKRFGHEFYVRWNLRLCYTGL